MISIGIVVTIVMVNMLIVVVRMVTIRVITTTVTIPTATATIPMNTKNNKVTIRIMLWRIILIVRMVGLV